MKVQKSSLILYAHITGPVTIMYILAKFTHGQPILVHGEYILSELKMAQIL